MHIAETCQPLSPRTYTVSGLSVNVHRVFASSGLSSLHLASSCIERPDPMPLLFPRRGLRVSLTSSRMDEWIYYAIPSSTLVLKQTM